METEKANVCEQKTLISELIVGRELANQLKNNLDPVESRETCEILLEKIVSSYEKALSLINLKALLGGTLVEAGLQESPPNYLNNVPSEASKGGFKRKCQKQVNKERKIAKLSEQVRICSGTGLEGPNDGGYSWRKYGQKEILGATFPRAYYRCTHRHTQGCLATKQVQRSDEDPAIFEFTYKGSHSCKKASHSTSTLKSVLLESSEQNLENVQIQKQEVCPTSLQFKSEPSYKTETESIEQIFPSFPFPSMPIESDISGNRFFTEHMMEINPPDSYSPSFLSPSPSESSAFSLSPFQIDIGYNLQGSKSDLNDMIATPTSVIDSTFSDFDFLMNHVDFDSPFDITGY